MSKEKHDRGLFHWLSESYRKEHQMYLDHLQHFTHLLIFLNISFFFLTELVTKQGYYYTYFSLLCLGIVQILLILPLNILHRLWCYMFLLITEGIGLYYLLTSVIYWVRTNSG